YITISRAFVLPNSRALPPRRAARARPTVALDAAGSTTRIGAQYLYPTLPTAIAAYHAAQRDSP
ncbi:hypothetical protein, partial [Nocardia farcinica]|uniref:hypothetical protein n=1 Tax=Nocardia farcinica TaxID=37329 RepID=UPI002455814C